MHFELFVWIIYSTFLYGVEENRDNNPDLGKLTLINQKLLEEGIVKNRIWK